MCVSNSYSDKEKKSNSITDSVYCADRAFTGVEILQNTTLHITFDCLWALNFQQYWTSRSERSPWKARDQCTGVSYMLIRYTWLICINTWLIIYIYTYTDYFFCVTDLMVRYNSDGFDGWLQCHLGTIKSVWKPSKVYVSHQKCNLLQFSHKNAKFIACTYEWQKFVKTYPLYFWVIFWQLVDCYVNLL